MTYFKSSIPGLPSHGYHHGLSALLWTGPPAAVAAAAAALLLVLPVFSADGSPFLSSSGRRRPGPVAYLRARFDSKVVEAAARILIMITWIVVLVRTEEKTYFFVCRRKVQ